jgi:hypothetical protein
MSDRRGFQESHASCGKNVDKVRPTGGPCRTTPAEERTPRMVKIAIVGLVGAFVIFYIMTSPDQAATMVKGAGHIATNVAHGMGDFLDKLAS